MPPRFHPLALAEFEALVDTFEFRRRIDQIHMHGTWRPRRADYRGEDTIDAMWRVHTQTNGWSDIAQHVTIAPDGTIWTGRDWNHAPASATGANGTSAAGPFMFEMIGDFDVGKEPLDGAQRTAAIRVIAKLRDRFRLPPEALVLHREIPSGKAQGKTCPGSSIDKATILQEVADALEAIRATRVATQRAFQAGDWAGPEHTAAKSRARAILAMLPSPTAPSRDEGEPPERENPAPDVARGRDVAFDVAALRPHVVTLHDGRFAWDGTLPTRPQDVDAIFAEHLPRWWAAHPGPLRIVFWAHGGLNDEAAGLTVATKQVAWWKANGVYPIHFVWHTGFWEALQQTLFGPRDRALRAARDFYDWTTDPGIEVAARALIAPGLAWSGMKRSAELSSADAGGARYVAQQLAAFCRDRGAGGAIELYAAGHSAGSIFHAYFLPVALREGVPRIEELFLLAPAARSDLFKGTIAPLVAGSIGQLTMFTMNDALERADSVGPYHKSLLYLVSNAFEQDVGAPILGLERALQTDAALRSLFGLAGGMGAARIVWSDGRPPTDPRASSTSRSHGGFDDDPPTMDSIVRRVTKNDAIVSFATVPRAVAVVPPTAGAGRRIGVCIGIDRYPSPNTLSGCVADAMDWQAALADLGFEMLPPLLDERATRQVILDLLRDVLGKSRGGDVVVFQFAGHGTWLDDLDGDEDDGRDEAFVPYDFGAGAFILDDDLWQVMRDVPDGVSVTCFFDCCHSGTITRVFGEPAPDLPPGAKARFIRPTREMNDAHRAFRAGLPRGRGPARHERNEMRRVVFSACQDDQVAEELNGRGSFSRRATAILRRDGGRLTNRAYWDAVVTAFGDDAKRQTPVLDCPDALRDGQLFGGLERAAAVPLPAPPAAAGAPPAPAAGPTAGGPPAAPMPHIVPASPVVARLLRDLADLLDGKR